MIGLSETSRRVEGNGRFEFTKRKPYVFRIGHLGDTLAAIPVLRAIWQKHAPTPFTLITNSPAQISYVTAWDVLKHTGLFDRVLYYDAKSPSTLVRIALDMRRHAKQPILYYLTPMSRERKIRDWTFFRVLCGAKIEGLGTERCVPRRGLDGALVRLPKEYERLLARFDNRDQLARDICIPMLTPPPDTRARIDETLSAIRNRPLIALGIGSKIPAKKWFVESYADITRRIVSTYPRALVVIVGGKEDESEGSRLAADVGVNHARNFAGKLDVIESAELLSRCMLYVGNDTGTMHLAACMGLQCLAIFSSRDNPGLWEPFGDRHVILRRELDCSGCMLTECIERRMECLRLITVDEVWHALEPLLKDAIAYWENNSVNQQVRS